MQELYHNIVIDNVFLLYDNIWCNAIMNLLKKQLWDVVITAARGQVCGLFYQQVNSRVYWQVFWQVHDLACGEIE